MELPNGIRSRRVDNGNGLSMHLLEAGFEDSARPCVLLLHGFPELAYSWRNIMLPLAAAGYHVVAPDQRGYGDTTGWQTGYEVELTAFGFTNLVTDLVGLLFALGRRHVDAVVGHDFGSPVAACCALMRPDVFRSLVMMSAPFSGPTTLPFATADDESQTPPAPSALSASMQAQLGRLDPPRKHYQWYYSTATADNDMRNAAQGLHDFLRAYFHVKSADWKHNAPYRLASSSAAELGKLPHYYVMAADEDMPASVAPHMPTAAEIAACAWLPDEVLAVYTRAYGRIGFQGGLNWYRCVTGGLNGQALALYAGGAIDVPACFISGASDWGVYQKPGDLEMMQSVACTRFTDSHLVDGAGHWVQQEQPEAVMQHLGRFLAAL